LDPSGRKFLSTDYPEIILYYSCNGAFKASRQRGTKQQEAGKFRSIRDRVQSIKFRVEDFKKGTWLPMLTKGLNFQTSELIPSYNVEYLP
jgi:hypothetical protein